MSAETKRIRIVARILLAVTAVNFLVFWIVAACIGGDALNGKSERGHYFLANHGKLTEVTRAVWNYSRFHAASVLVTFPVCLMVGVGMLLYVNYKERPGGDFRV